MADVDVLIVGAGLSGVGMACHLERELPEVSYTVLESRDALGGTWDLFRYPGIRSDSDMYTLGFRFRPWMGEKAIADGPSILEYVRDTAAEYGVDRNIRYGHAVVRAEWSSADGEWAVTARSGGSDVTLRAKFLVSCSGYYRYDQGYSPEFPGREQFSGTIVHPQHWPQDLDYTDKQVAIIGSGATAVTLAPAMAPVAAGVTMVQRSPTYVVSAPAKDPLAMSLRRFLPNRVVYPVVRAKQVLVTTAIYQLCRRYPDRMKALLRKYQTRWLPKGYDIDTHFTPSYNPWDQRLCLVPSGDLFREIRKGRVAMATGGIETFTADGLRLTTGEHVPADIIVTATGLNLLAFGGVELVVDGEPVDMPNTMAYKGIMLSGLPNFGYIIGYTNASWTLKADLAAEYLCRVIRHMRRKGFARCVPVRDPDVALEPFLDLDSGYIKRAQSELPKQGSKAPWRLRQNYLRDLVTLRHGRLLDPALHFARPGAAALVPHAAPKPETPERVTA
ncbi:MAG: NAD(P)/FAD-dependent oxidoreductase [Mycobacteriaceae bacterium]|nr:NAD(P)/FAD-dependent oxidoreductase [Mycobacteriaceae bacterium]